MGGMSGKKPKLFVREWRLVPSEWREATPEEVEEFEKKFGKLDLTPLDEVFREGVKPMVKLVEEVDRIARFVRKLEEALRELER